MWIYYLLTLLVGVLCTAFALIRLPKMRSIQRARSAWRFVTTIAASYRYKFDTSETLHGGDLVTQCLKHHGVKKIFTLSGGHISPILVSCENAGIRVVDTRHEVNAVFAADSVARLSGQLGVAVVTSGPGVTNTITAVKNAQMAQSPMLILGGAAATVLKGRGALQDIDQVSMMQSVCKETFVVDSVRNIVPAMKDAARIAMTDTQGPVFIEFPIDILYPYAELKKHLSVPPGKTLVGKIVAWAMDRYSRGIFAGGFLDWNYKPLLPERVAPRSNSIHTATANILDAKKPFIVVGSQVMQSENGSPSAIAEALEAMRIPCSLAGMSRGLLGPKSDIQVRHSRRVALREADLIILAGAVVDFRLNYGRDFRPDQKVIVVNVDEDQMRLNYGVTYHAQELLEGDPGMFLVYLRKEMEKWYAKVDPAWTEHLRALDRKKDEEIVAKAAIPTNQHLNVIKVLRTLDECLDDNSVLVADGGDFIGTAAYTLRPRGPLTWLDPGPFGTLGVGGGFALGSKLMRPDAEVWLLWGDGSSGYSFMEFDTFKRHNTPVIAVIGNDASWKQIERGQVATFGAPTACKLEYTPYHKIADAFGAVGFQLDRSNEADMKDIFMEAKRLNRDGKSVVINVLLGESDFRQASTSV